MSNTTLDLLYTLSIRSNYNSYIKYIPKGSLTTEVQYVVTALKGYFSMYEDVEVVDFKDLYDYSRLMIGIDSASVEKILKNLIDYEPSTSRVLERYIVKDANEQIQSKLLDSKGEANLEDIRAVIDKAEEKIGRTEGVSDLYITTDFDELVDSTVAKGGYSWRAEHLNKSAGRYRGGDLVVVVKRPETGGTSFVCSETTFLVSQLEEDEDIIIFNNEEAGRKIGMRLREAALDTNSQTILKDVPKYKELYDKHIGQSRIQVVHDTSLSTQQVESVLKNHPNVRCVVFNVLPKMHGFNGVGSEVERQHELFKWARHIADKHDCAVFAVVQAGSTAEGKEYLDMNDVYMSKTGIQSEADLLLMIGKSHDEALRKQRFMSIAKNKLQPTEETDPELKHARFVMDFDQMTGRFTT